MTSFIRIVQDWSFKDAESKVNALLEEFDKQGYVAEILNLTPVTPLEKVSWRFVLMFTEKSKGFLEPPIES